MYKSKVANKLCIVMLLLLCMNLWGCSSSGLSTFLQKDEEAIRQEFDTLIEEMFVAYLKENTINMHYLLADPAAYGIEDYEIILGEFSLENKQEAMLALKTLKERTEQIDDKALDETQQLTYEILDSYIETELMAEGLELYDNPLTSYTGQQVELPILLSEYAFYSRQDVENYLELLSQIDEYYSQIMEFEREKAEAGLFMSDASADRVIASCEAYLTTPEDSFLTASFSERLAELGDLTKEEVEDYKERHLGILENDFIPAYGLLTEELEGLKGNGTNEMGLYYFPEGKEYYEYLLKSTVGPSYSSVNKLKKAVEGKVYYNLNKMYELLQENPALAEEWDRYSFTCTEPEEILRDLQEQIKEDFPEIPKIAYSVKYVPKSQEEIVSPAFYLVPPIDKASDNAVYINGSDEYKDDELYPILAHEGYPGHMYQTNYFHQQDMDPLRIQLSTVGYTEGWGVYAEMLSYEFDNGLEEEMKEFLACNKAASLALSALLDINIHYYGWGLEETGRYLSENFGYTRETVNDVYEMIIDNPIYYVKYYVGYMEIAQMRKEAEKELGEDFDLKTFHTFILDMGPAPFAIIREHFEEDYLIGDCETLTFLTD